jgi:mRNA interferase RelE/StbE
VAAYTIDVRPRARRSLRQFDPSVRKAVALVIDSLATDPRPPGVLPVTGHRPYLRVRSGDYRVIYVVDDRARRVTVAAVGHRREVYRGLDL